MMKITEPAPNQMDRTPWVILAMFALVMGLVTALYFIGTMINPMSRTLGY